MYVVFSLKETVRANEIDDRNLPWFWNNDIGWTPLENATVFTEEQRHTLNLPTIGNNDAVWVRLPNKED